MVTECIYGRKKEGRKGGRHTRWFHSGDPVSTACVKKKKKGGKKKRGSGGKEKTSTSPSKTRGGKRENFIFPRMSLPLFSLPPAFFSSLPLFTLCFTYTLNLCQSLLCPPHRPSPLHPPPLSSLNFLPPIILSPSVSLRHVFQGPPSIDTVSTNSSPPVPSQEPLGVEGGRGEPGEGLRGEGLLGTW